MDGLIDSFGCNNDLYLLLLLLLRNGVVSWNLHHDFLRVRVLIGLFARRWE
jgi:hypothetical protein